MCAVVAVTGERPEGIDGIYRKTSGKAGAPSMNAMGTQINGKLWFRELPDGNYAPKARRSKLNGPARKLLFLLRLTVFAKRPALGRSRHSPLHAEAAASAGSGHNRFGERSARNEQLWWIPVRQLSRTRLALTAIRWASRRRQLRALISAVRVV